MKIYIADAFTSERFCGNQAGVALISAEDKMPEESFMRALAAELRHSETAFVRPAGPGRFELRYFTPRKEVELCGHATVAAFSVMRSEGVIASGGYTALTRAGELAVEVSEKSVWMDMAEPKLLRKFTAKEAAAMYEAFGLEPEQGLPAELISTGLADIILPVKNREKLGCAVMDRERVKDLSEKYDSVGFHMFCPGEGAAAHCRNFAPRVGIDEECATGTANGALTVYLWRAGLTEPERENLIVQGEAMGRRSEIRTRITKTGGVKVGGDAVISLRCSL